MLGQRLKSGVIEKMGWSILLPLYTVVNIQWEKYGPFTCFKRDVFAIKILVHTTTLEKWSRLLHNNPKQYILKYLITTYQSQSNFNTGILAQNCGTIEAMGPTWYHFETNLIQTELKIIGSISLTILFPFLSPFWFK